MLARDLATVYPTVRLDAPAIDAARLLSQQNLPGLIVVDGHGRPFAVLPGTQVLRMAVPTYYLDDPALARVVEEGAADELLHQLNTRTVAQCLPEEENRELPVVEPDANVLEIAALMAQSRSPVVAVVDPESGMVGAITLAVLMSRLVQR